MRRYAVRFLVAVLTFGLGVALSFALGLFRVPHTRIALHRWSESSSCRKNSRIAKSSLLTVDNQANDPLQVVYQGPILHSDLAGKTGARLLIENKSNKTITGYLIGAELSWHEHGKSGSTFMDSSGNLRLEPGESHTITLQRAVDSRFLVRVQWVAFQDGSRWLNPRTTQ